MGDCDYYNGLRFTADAADCAMPISIDNKSGCDFQCRYCFSNSLMRAAVRDPHKRAEVMAQNGNSETTVTLNDKLWPLQEFKQFMEHRLKGRVPEAMYPVMDSGQPLQLGALGDAFDFSEIKVGWALEFLKLVPQYKTPIRISTKGANTILRKEYLEAFKEAGKYLFVTFSLIHPEDEVMKWLDYMAPVPTKRFEAMKALSDNGVWTGLRYRPIFPQLALKKMPNGDPAWKVMIDKTVEAGGKSLSFEFIFFNQSANDLQRSFYREIQRLTCMPNFVHYWKHHSVRNQSCLRANRLVKYHLFKNIYTYAKEQGLQIGISDPHFKEFSMSAQCCGVPDGHPMFGNFSHKNLTDLVVRGRKAFEENGDNLQFHFEESCPDWAYQVRLGDMVCLSSAEKHRMYENCTWADKLRNSWNNPRHFRSPYYYFEGVLHPVGVDKNRNVIYEYRDWATQIYKNTEKLRQLEKDPTLIPMPSMPSLKEAF